MTDTAEVSVDRERLSRRRVETGYSQRALAAVLGVSESTVRKLEKQADVTVDAADVEMLAEALSCPSGWLTGDDDLPVPSDAAVVGATLARAADGQLIAADAVAEGLGWTLQRVRDALGELDDLLSGCGLVVHRSAYGVGLRSAVDAADDQQVAAVMRCASRRDSLPVDEAKMLVRVAAGRSLPNSLSNNQNVCLRTLVNAGLVEVTTGSSDEQRVRLTEYGREALAVDVLDEPWVEPQPLVARTPPGRLPWLDEAGEDDDE